LQLREVREGYADFIWLDFLQGEGKIGKKFDFLVVLGKTLFLGVTEKRIK